MILTGSEIARQHSIGAIVIEPFTAAHLNPNSYDVKIGDKLVTYCEQVLDPKKENSVAELTIPPCGLVLKGGSFYLGATVERIGSKQFVPILHGKSGTARAGLFVHVTADLIDIGSIGNITLQLAPVVDVLVYPNTRIAQISFWCVSGAITLYDGKYQNSIGPQPSKSFLDFRRSQCPNPGSAATNPTSR